MILRARLNADGFVSNRRVKNGIDRIEPAAGMARQAAVGMMREKTQRAMRIRVDTGVMIMRQRQRLPQQQQAHQQPVQAVIAMPLIAGAGAHDAGNINCGYRPVNGNHAVKPAQRTGTGIAMRQLRAIRIASMCKPLRLLPDM